MPMTYGPAHDEMNATIKRIEELVAEKRWATSSIAWTLAELAGLALGYESSSPAQARAIQVFARGVLERHVSVMLENELFFSQYVLERSI
jgi:hypothetical protein